MKAHFGLKTVLAMALSTTIAFSQAPDPTKKISGWARVDKDGSIAFYDPGTRKIYSWMREAGIVSELDVSKLSAPPEKWVLDFSSNAWIVSGKTLTYLEKSGKTFSLPLPYEVGDLAWNVNGFYLSYKTPEPFVEMRGFDSGSVVWYVKNRAMKAEGTSQAMHRIAVNEEKTLFIGSQGSLQVDQIDCNNGRSKGMTSLSYKGALAPTLTSTASERAPMAWWLNKNTVVQAVRGSQLPSPKMSGLVLAFQDLDASMIEFFPTGLNEQHIFIGMIDYDAVFMAPGGGLVFVKVPETLHLS